MTRYVQTRCLHSALVFAFSVAVVLAFGERTTADDALKAKLQEKLEAMECPGAIIGIFRSDGSTEKYVLGVADVNTKAPMQADMHMRIASITKPFLGTTVLKLVDEGLLSLDDPIAKYVDGVPGGDRITLRQLGTNTSGLFNSIENKELQYAIMAKPTKDWSAKEILDFAFAHDPYAAPGERFRYSNTNAVLLGMVIEKITGKNWAEVVHDRVIEPLGLKETGVPAPGGALPEPRPSAYRNGYVDKVIGYGDTFYDVTNYSASWTNAAGSLYSTVDDLGRAIKPLATGQLLKEQGRKELYSWVETNRPGLLYGFCIGQLKGGVGHTGDVPGFNATALYFKDHDCSIVSLSNLSNNNDRQTMPAEVLADMVIDHLHLRPQANNP